MPLFRRRNRHRDLPDNSVTFTGANAEYVCRVGVTQEGFATGWGVKTLGTSPSKAEFDRLRNDYFQTLINEQATDPDLRQPIGMLLLDNEDDRTPNFNPHLWVDHDTAWVRGLVARQQSITQRDLRKLCGDDQAIVRFHAVMNPRMLDYTGLVFGDGVGEIPATDFVEDILLRPSVNPRVVEWAWNRPPINEVVTYIATYAFDKLPISVQNEARSDPRIWEAVARMTALPEGFRQGDVEEYAANSLDDWRSYFGDHGQGQPVHVTFARFVADTNRTEIIGGRPQRTQTQTSRAVGRREASEADREPAVSAENLTFTFDVQGSEGAITFDITPEGMIYDWNEVSPPNTSREEFFRGLAPKMFAVRDGDESAEGAGAGVCAFLLLQQIRMVEMNLEDPNGGGFSADIWANHSDFRIRALVARQHTLSEQCLRQLCFDPHPLVRFLAVFNPLQWEYEGIVFGRGDGEIDPNSTIFEVVCNPATHTAVITSAWGNAPTQFRCAIALFAFTRLSEDDQSEARTDSALWSEFRNMLGNISDFSDEETILWVKLHISTWHRYYAENGHGQSVLATMKAFGREASELMIQNAGFAEEVDPTTVEEPQPNPFIDAELPPPPTDPGIPEGDVGTIDDAEVTFRGETTTITCEVTADGMITDCVALAHEGATRETFSEGLAQIGRRVFSGEASAQEYRPALIFLLNSCEEESDPVIPSHLLADYPDFRIRALVARQTSLIPRALKQLCDDPHPLVRYFATNNPRQNDYSDIVFGNRPGEVNFVDICAEIVLNPATSDAVRDYGLSKGVDYVSDRFVVGYMWNHLSRPIQDVAREADIIWQYVAKHFGLEGWQREDIERFCGAQSRRWLEFHDKVGFGVPIVETYCEFINTPSFINSLPAGAELTDGGTPFVYLDSLGNLVVEVNTDPYTTAPSVPVAPTPPAQRPPASVVRTWARRRGLSVPARGRLSAEIYDAYNEAHSGI